MSLLTFQGDLFGGLNSGLQDGLLSRAEALAADLGKHNAGTPMPLKHDPVSVYHHGTHMPTPHPNNRPHHQVHSHLFVSLHFSQYYTRTDCSSFKILVSLTKVWILVYFLINVIIRLCSRYFECFLAIAIHRVPVYMKIRMYSRLQKYWNIGIILSLELYICIIIGTQLLFTKMYRTVLAYRLYIDYFDLLIALSPVIDLSRFEV